MADILGSAVLDGPSTLPVAISPTQPTPVTTSSGGPTAATALALLPEAAGAAGAAATGLLNATATVLNSGAAPLLLAFGAGVYIVLQATKRRR